MYNKVICLLVLIIIMLSCNNSKTKLEIEVEVIKLDNNLSFSFNEKFELTNKIQLETKSECLISNIVSITIMDSIYILDSNQQLFVFDNDGYFVSQIGFKGNGPEEYLSISDFYVNDSAVVVIDSRKEKLISYDKSGKYLNDEKLPASFMYITKNDSFNICYLGNSGGDFAYAKNDNYYRLLFCSTDYQVISGYSIFPSKSLGSIYDTGSPFYEYLEKTFFIEPINDTIYRIEGATIIPSYVVDFGNHKRPSNFTEKTPAPELYRAMTDNDYAKSISGFYNFSNMIYFLAFIGNQNNKHVFYDKNTRQTSVTSDIIDITNNIKVKPRVYKWKGEKKYFLSIITPMDILDNKDLYDESNPTLIFYTLKDTQ